MKTIHEPIRRANWAMPLCALLTTLAATPALAQQVEKPEIKFSLGWLFQATQAQFPFAAQQGFFKAQGLDVTVDRGAGSATSVQRVVSGAYDYSYADVGTIVKWNLENPGRELTIVYVVEDACPLAVVSLKKSGIAKPGDLEGKRLGAPTFDGGRQMFPVFAKSSGIDASKVSWLSMDANLREQMLLKGEVDAITGFVSSAIPTLAALGAGRDQLNVLSYGDYGFNCYGNAVFGSREFVRQHPATTRALVKGVNEALKAMVANPRAAVEALRARDPLIKTDVESSRMALYIKDLLLTPHARKEGFSTVDTSRIQQTIDATVQVFGIPRTTTPAAIYSDQYLPARAERIPPAYGG